MHLWPTDPMLAAAAVKTAAPAAFTAGSFGWFDLVVAALLLFGFIRGRKRGMSLEFMDIIQWLTIVILGAVLYDPLGRLLVGWSGMGLLYSYLIAYITLAIVVKTMCTIFKRTIGEKLVSTETFGSLEYYLGMIAGIVRLACVVVFVLAILNARKYTDAELAALEKARAKDLEGIRFPTLDVIQKHVFKGSFSGYFMAQTGAKALIEPTSPPVEKDSIKKQKEREMDRLLGK